jgi:hypothetical protein
MKTMVVKESPDGHETIEEATFPPMVYVPLSGLPQGEEVSVDLRPMPDGRLALLVYSALDRLVACCGDQQPWAVMPTASLEQIQAGTGFEVIFLDLKVPDELRRRSEPGED